MERATGTARRRRLSLSLRGTMLLIVALGLWLGWQARLARQQREAVAAIREYGGFVRYDWELVDGKPVPGASPKARGWLRRAIGEDYFQTVVVVDIIHATDRRGMPVLTTAETDALMEKLAAFPRLRQLYIPGELATDRAMGTIAGLTELETLMLWGSRLTESGFAKVRGLRSLRELQVIVLHEHEDTRLGDAALAHLAPLVRLEHLNLNFNPITDAGMVHLKGLKSLEFLALHGTAVSDAGLDALRGLVNLKEIWVPDTVSEEGWTRFHAEMPNLHTIR